MQSENLCSLELRENCGQPIARSRGSRSRPSNPNGSESFTLHDPRFHSPSLSDEERQCLILKHLPQVRLLARRIHGRLPESVSLDDLVSTGIVGLISAIDRFDPSRHVQLRAYAEHKIKGGILDSLRRLDWAPRQQRKRAKQIQVAIAAVEQRLHRAPTEQEIAAELDITVDRYREWQVQWPRTEPGKIGDGIHEFPETRAAPLPFRRSGRATVRRF